MGPARQVQTPERQPNLQEPYRLTRKANVVCALEWLKGEPCMFLLTYPRIEGGKGYAIPLSRIPLYVTDTGVTLPRFTDMTRYAALRMGLDDTGPTLTLLSDVILANIADLRAMPKSPPKPH